MFTIPPCEIRTYHPILNVLIKMKNEGKADHSINSVNKALIYLSKHADLDEPEQVKQYIANKQASNGHKNNLCIAYNRFCKHYQIQWQIPQYKPQSKIIRIPTKEQIEILTASAGRTLSIKLTISKETGLRPIELCNLKVKDIDLEQKIVYPATAKHGSARALKISNNLQMTLKRYVNTSNLNPNDKLFKGTAEYYGDQYRIHRNKLAKKLNKPELRTIRLYDFRHYYATRLYAKTRDILLVKQQMGHKRIETTLIYTQLLNLNDDEWTCKATTNTEQAQQLIENGFEYVTTTPDELMLFRKRK